MEKELELLIEIPETEEDEEDSQDGDDTSQPAEETDSDDPVDGEAPDQAQETAQESKDQVSSPMSSPTVEITTGESGGNDTYPGGKEADIITNVQPSGSRIQGEALLRSSSPSESLPTVSKPDSPLSGTEEATEQDIAEEEARDAEDARKVAALLTLIENGANGTSDPLENVAKAVVPAQSQQAAPVNQINLQAQKAPVSQPQKSLPVSNYGWRPTSLPATNTGGMIEPSPKSPPRASHKGGKKARPGDSHDGPVGSSLAKSSAASANDSVAVSSKTATKPAPTAPLLTGQTKVVYVTVRVGGVSVARKPPAFLGSEYYPKSWCLFFQPADHF
jgi:hypothetical protein